MNTKLFLFLYSTVSTQHVYSFLSVEGLAADYCGTPDGGMAAGALGARGSATSAPQLAQLQMEVHRVTSNAKSRKRVQSHFCLSF